MDSRYAHIAMSESEADYENASGWLKGVFGKAKDAVGNMSDEQKAAAGTAAIGLITLWGSNRKAKKQAEAEARARASMPPPPPPKSNTMLYVVGGVAVVGIGIAIYFATRKK